MFTVSHKLFKGNRVLLLSFPSNQSDFRNQAVNCLRFPRTVYREHVLVCLFRE